MSWQKDGLNNSRAGKEWNRFQARPGYIAFDYHSTWAYRSSKWRKKYHCCAMNPLQHTAAIHHMYYRRSAFRQVIDRMFRGIPFGVSIAGAEIIGWDVVPLSDRNHDARMRRPGTAHHRDNWRTNKQSQFLNRNTELFIWRCRLQFLAIYYWWLTAPVLLALVFIR